MLRSFLRAAARSKGSCIRNEVSGVLPKALVKRMAISGLIPDLPLTTLLRAWRVTPRTFAPAVTDRPSGSRQALSMLAPGWGGSCIGMLCFAPFCLVVVNQFDIERFRIVQTENNPPVGPYRDGPEPR